MEKVFEDADPAAGIKTDEVDRFLEDYRPEGETLAAGLSPGDGSGIAPDLVRMQLKPGSLALVASDGVLADAEDDWLKEMLNREEADMKTLAKLVLREAEKRFGAADDMTVVTVRVEERV